MASTKVFHLREMVFVLVVFALLNCIEGNGHVNSTELPDINGQNSTIFILNELNVTSSYTTASTDKADYDLFDTSIGSSPASTTGRHELPQSSPTDSNFSTLPGDKELKNVEENSRTDSSQNVVITEVPVVQSTSSSKITWSPGVSLSIFPREEQLATSTVQSHESELEEVSTQHSTPDIYNSLNHDDNELDAEVKYSKMVSAINNTASPTVQFYKSSSTLPGTESSISMEETPSLLNDLVTSSPISLDSESEPPKTTISVIESTPSSSVTDEVSESSSFSVSVTTSSLTSEENHPNFSTMSEFEKESTLNSAESSAQTKADLDGTTHSYETQKSESPFRHTRSMGDFATGFSDHSISSTQESVTPTENTENTNLNSTVLISSDSMKHETSFPLNSTNNEFTSISLMTTLLSEATTSHSIDENISVQDSETESPTRLHSITTIEAQDETSTEIQRDMSPTDPSQSLMLSVSTTSHPMNENVSIQNSETESPTPLHSIIQDETSTEIQIDLSHTDLSEVDLKGKSTVDYNVSDSFVPSTLSKLDDPIPTLISRIASSTQSQSSSDHSTHIPDVTTTTVLNITAMQDNNITTSDSLLKINDLSMLTEANLSLEEQSFSLSSTAPSEEETNVTKEARDISNVSTDLPSILESDSTAVQDIQATTSSSLLKINDSSLETSHSIEEHSSSMPSLFDESKMVATHSSNLSNIADEPTTIKDVDSVSDAKEILTSLPSAIETTDFENQSTLSTDVAHQKLDETTIAIDAKYVSQTTTSKVDPSNLSSFEPTTTLNPITFVTQDKVSSSTKETFTSTSEFESTFFDSGESTSASTINEASGSSTSFVQDPLISSDQTSPKQQDESTTPDLSPTTDQASLSTSTIDEKSDTSTHLPLLTEVNTQDHPTTMSSDIHNISSTEVTTSSSSSKTSASIHVFPSMLSTSEPGDTTGETLSTSGMESKEETSVPLSTKSSFDYTSAPTSNPATETHREGKRIPFSTESSRKATVESSNNVIFISSTQMMEQETTTMSIMEELFDELYYEDLTSRDQDNVITAVVQLPSQDMDNLDIDSKVSLVHNWLTHVLMKEFQNWTKDPFDEIGSNSSDVPFGKISIFYLSPTPNIQSSNITMSFIVHNQWRNDTLPVDFVLSILKFYSKDFKQSMNATLVDFYHGLPVKDMDLIPLIIEKYGALVFITVVVAVASIIFICVLVIYRKKHRRSVHYLSTGKLQHNLPESVGIDLTPDVVILQDEKKILNGNNKICDDEGWLVPIHEVPLAEDSNMPKVQDTKL